MVKHNFCANFSADVELIVQKLWKTLFLPQHWLLKVSKKTKSNILQIICYLSTAVINIEYVLFVSSLILTTISNIANNSVNTTNIKCMLITNGNIPSSCLITFLSMNYFLIYSIITAFIFLLFVFILAIFMQKYGSRWCHKLIRPFRLFFHSLGHCIKKYRINTRDAKIQKVLHQKQ